MRGVTRACRTLVLILLTLVTVVPGSVAAEPAPAGAALFDPDRHVDYQLGGGYRSDAGIVVRDRTDAVDPDAYNVCYVNGYQTQPGSGDFWSRQGRGALLLRQRGNPVHDPGWRDEVLLDTSTAEKRRRLAAIVGRWVAGCAVDGFRAVEVDNLDSFTRSRGLLTRRDNLRLARVLAARAHAAGLAYAQKNLAGLPADRARSVGFDFAVAEDCQVYDECGTYRRVYGRHVIDIEYADEGRSGFERACARRGDLWPIVFRDRDLRLPGQRGYVRESC